MKNIKSRKIHPKRVEIVVDEVEEVIMDKKDKIKVSNNINIPMVLFLCVILSLISGVLGAYLIINTYGGNVTTSGGVITSSVKLEETNSIATAVDKVYDSVVVVEVYSNKQLVSTGTGFVYKKSNKKAYLMTNYHVISDGDTIKVLFTDDTELEATIVGGDVYSDIAVLSVADSDSISCAVMGDSSKSKVGDTVFTVGSPEGSDYAGTVTKGVLSAKERLVEVALSNSQTSDYYMEVLQTDAAINPGNSGGPICNTNGEVIGITNMKLVDDTVEGMGFAIPIEEALEVASLLESDGKISRPYIGISMLDISNSYYLWQAGIIVPSNIEEGIAVYNVENNSPASVAGLKKGDIIIELAGVKVGSLAEFRYELYKHSPQEEVEITFVRDSKVQTTKLTLGKSE